MAVKTRAQTYTNAKKFSTSHRYMKPGYCLMWCRQMAGISSKYKTALLSAHHAPRRMGTPPKGTFVYWRHNNRRNDPGHIAISAGGGYVYTTDYPRSGRVGKVKIIILSFLWNMSYLGWSDECNDVGLRSEPHPDPIIPPRPKPHHKPKPYPKPKHRVVYYSKLEPGQNNSDSVWWAQHALNRVPVKGGKHIALTGDYGSATKARVKLFQSQKLHNRATGDLLPHQVRHLFKMARVKVTLKERP